MQRLRDLAAELNLPEPDCGFAIGPGLHVLIGYPDERAGIVAAPAPADTGGWRLFACDPADETSLRSALGALAAQIGRAQAARLVATDPQELTAGQDQPLTPEQEAAVRHAGGPARVLAGAGTGKTRTIVARFHHLVQSGVPAGRILVLTFSREAAADMRAKILRDLQAGGQIWVSTFHSFCLRLLRAEPAREPLLVHEAESRAILAALHQKHNWHWYTGSRAGELAGEAFAFISQAKDHLLSPEDVANYADHRNHPRLQDLAAAYRLFQAELAAEGGAEFSDFIYEAVRLLRDDPGVADRWQSRFDQILVDEFQDANLAQFRVLQALARTHSNLMVVGDDDQAIYRFRGATDRFLVRFGALVPGAADYPVTENFRCPEPVLQLANRLIAQNGSAKQLRPHSARQGAVTHLQARTDREEAEAVAQEIARRLRQGRRPHDFAIICRSVRRSGSEFARALAARSIPYRLVGEEREHPAVAQAIGLLRLVDGTATRDEALQVLAALVAPESLHGAIREAGSDLRGYILRLLPEAQGRSLAERVYQALRALGHLRLSLQPDAAEVDRLASVAALQQQAAVAGSVAELSARLRSAAAAGGAEVAIMTAHAAKGLEFPVVFVTGLAEGRFPAAVDAAPVYHTAEAIREWADTGALDAPDAAGRLAQHLKEERRLAYVALTRAKEELILTRARLYGSEPAQPSRFLAEMQAPEAIDVAGRLGDPLALARTYLVRVASGAERPEADRVAAARSLLQAEPSAIPIRRQAEPQPYAPGESLHLSATSLETYRECPRRYYYARVLGWEEEESVYLAFGSGVHDALEGFNRARLQGRTPAWADLEGALHSAITPDRFETPGQHRQMLERAVRFLRRYYDWAAPQEQQVVAVEQAFSVPYVDREGRTHTLRGRYDLILQTPDGLEIVDYKTGHRKGSTTVNKRRARSDNDPDRKLQLGLYYLAYHNGQVVEGTRITYRFLRHPDDKPPGQFVPIFNEGGEQVIGCTHTAESLQAIQDRVDDIIEGILANRFERTDDTSKCRYCPFQTECEVSPRDWF